MNKICKGNWKAVCLILSIIFVSFLFIVMAQIQPTYAASESDVGISDLKFTLYTNTENGKSEYKVLTLNRNIKQVEIPDTYNDVPVTEVADNAFTNCKQLEYVLIPSTIRRVGNNAFANCTALKKIVGMTNVKILGNYVFNNCTMLEDLILPAKLEYVGTSIIKNVGKTTYSRKSQNELTAMNATWDLDRDLNGQILFGNNLVFTDITMNGVEGFAVEMYQSIATEDDIVLYSSAYDSKTNTYKPILNINKRAFADCQFGNFTLKHDGALNLNPTININSNAFSGVIAQSISIEVDITLSDPTEQDTSFLEGEKGYSIGLFEWTQVNSFTLPQSLERITRSMFSFSSVSEIRFNEEANKLSDNIKRIDTSAFEAAFYLKEIFLPSNIEILGDNIFNFWGDGGVYEKQIVHIDLVEAPTTWSSNWKEGINGVNAEIKFEAIQTKFSVILDDEGGAYGSNNVIAEFDKPMPSAIVPIKENYIFQGYYSGRNGTGVKYYNADMTSAQNWNIQSDSILYAYWKGVQSQIYFDFQGGIASVLRLNVEYGKPMPDVAAPKRGNYIFQGYYTSPNGNGIRYYDSNMNSVRDCDITEKTTLYAFWRGITIMLDLDMQGGIGNNDKVAAIYHEILSGYGVKAPTKENYIFQGYFEFPNGEGEKYFDSEMKSNYKWDNPNSATLYAHWIGVDCTVIFDKKGGEGGTDYVVVEYGKLLPTAVAPSLTGYTFLGYYVDNEIYYTDSMECNKPWNYSKTTTLTAKWKNQNFMINFEFEGGNEGDKVTIATYNEPMKKAIAPSRIGYSFKGYYTEKDGKGVQYYNSNMYSSRNWDIADDATLYAYWSPIAYIITFDKQGGTNGENSVIAYYGELLPASTAPSRYGYEFGGYYSKINGNGTKFYESDMLGNYKWTGTENTTLYAKWIDLSREFNFYKYEGTYDNHFSLRGDEKYKLNVGESIQITAPDIEGYVFAKWQYTRSLPRQRNYVDENYSLERTITVNYVTIDNIYRNNFIATYTKACVAEGTLIILADGSQVPVEQLTGNEQLLVWNLKTGAFDTAPILFIDSDKRMNYEVINLEFSDGTTVKVISEHAFWDFDLNEYVFLRRDAAQYIGHWFNRQTLDSEGNMTWTKVQLTSVTVRDEYTSAWSPVTYSHLCYYVNGMLSMPGATEGLINIFDVDGETMKYDEESYQADLENYGTFTYEEFVELFPVPREIFDAFNGEYLKVSLGKGLITKEQLGRLIESYAKFFM